MKECKLGDLVKFGPHSRLTDKVAIVSYLDTSNDTIIFKYGAVEIPHSVSFIPMLTGEVISCAPLTTLQKLLWDIPL